jgi:hypothetical protein
MRKYIDTVIPDLPFKSITSFYYLYLERKYQIAFKLRLGTSKNLANREEGIGFSLNGYKM